MNALFPFNGTRHLAEDQLLEASSSCPLCGGGERRSVAQVQADPDVYLLHCATCRGTSVSRMPTQAALAALYAGFYQVDSQGTAEAHITFGNVDRFGSHLARYAAPVTACGALRILDFGGGDGTVAINTAEKLRASGVQQIEVCVVDYHGSPASSADPGITVSRADALETLSAVDFDFVIASGVVEHVPDPHATVSALLARLRRGGLFYARTPHVLPYMRLSGKNAVPWFFPFPAHLHDLGQQFWEHCFAELLPDSDGHLLRSCPAIVQVSFGQNWKVALASHLAKAPWYLLGKHYPFVGGWEVLAVKG